MKEIALTPTAARTLAIPATQELLEGWVGPVEMSATYDVFAGAKRRFSPDRWFACVSHGMISRPGVVWVSHPPVRATYSSRSPSTEGAFNGGEGAQQGDCSIYRLRLPLSRREVAHRVIDVAGFGGPADLSAFRGPIAAEGWTSADIYGDPEAPPTVVHVARHVERLHRRALRRRYPCRRRFVRRREAYGLRCSAQGCGRKAFFVSPRVSPLCKVHFDDDVPF